MAKLHIRKGDKVMVITGKDKGRVAPVTRVIPESSRVVVEKTNMIKKHQGPTRQDQRGGIIDVEAPLHVSNVMIVCPHCDKPTRVSMGTNKDGKKVRVCKRCGKAIDE